MSYKYGHLAAQAIESVLNQTKQFDVVRFYDDGAGDCKHLPDIYPEVEFILRPKNLGIIDNFNDALKQTSTEQVMFLGADNWLHPKTLELLSTAKEDIVSYPAWLVKQSDYERWEPGVPHGSSLYNVELAKKAGSYQASGNEHTEEDSELFKKMKASGATVGLIDMPLLFYRWAHRKNYNKH